MRRAWIPVATLLAAVALAATGCTGGGVAHPAASAPAPSAGQAAPSTAPAAPSPRASARTSSPAPARIAWLSYHGDAARTGAFAGAVPSAARRLWSADLGASVFGQPVVLGDTVFAGTERDEVVALDRTTGAVRWSRSLGTPLTDVAAAAGCGDVDPLGITSSLAIDAARDEVFAVGEVVDGNGGVHHRLVGLDAATGAVELSEDVDPPLAAGETSLHLLQRAGLALGNGRVYIGFGGNDGDCGSYHGWLVGASETAPGGLVSFEVAPDGQGGAIWLSGGAPALDASGNVYVTTGNANPFPAGVDRQQYTESVVKLSSALRVEAAFKDPLAGGDEDLATGNPVLLPGGLVFAVGKTDVGYALRASDLARVAEVRGVCDSDPDGGPAYDPVTERLFVPCRGGGIQVVDTRAWTLGPRLAGANSAPIVVGGALWATSYPGGGLVELGAASGRLLQSLSTGPVPHFATPSFAAGALFLGTTTGVTAFGG
ncbi:MAG: PQQ-binding-like beta-propeller repeat protein [Microbacteriaceae bacterium]|nr:PQQ-binding-like beta-propeller repeat protein [Microbacteriaceae bacterium]MCL2796181.1 PQQ-binding-like beta-propeller repeat protein [Microbacteriaceae bacterium]